MNSRDIRWIQRLNHFSRAFARLKDAVELARARDLSELEEQGMIQAFEFTHELAWKTLKDFLEGRGARGLYGSKDATREAFKQGLITNGETWMNMVESRNLTSHTYNEDIAKAIVKAIRETYFGELEGLLNRLAAMKAGEAP
jgi:nucleotidyltransferase substrate binding protein (TIGR01987 family)